MVEITKNSQLRLVVVDDNDSFLAMADEWRTLAKQSAANFFLSWEWHYTWWQVYGAAGDQLYLLRCYADDELVGILPLYSRSEGLLRRRTLRFLGTGEAREDEVATEYLDVIAIPEHASQVANAALDWITSGSQWHKAELRFMLDDAAIVKAYRSREELHVVERNVGYRYRANLSNTEDQYLDSLSKSRAKRLERSRRALERDGGLDQYPVEKNDHEALNAAFQQLAELNHERQADKMRKSAFSSDKFDQFHRSVFELLFSHGAVNIHQFKLKHNVLAVVYCFYDETTCYYYQSGFVKRMANKYMPLTFAHLAEMQRNRDNGKQYYDLMRAEPPTYKEEFGCETTPMVTTFLFGCKTTLNIFCTVRAARRTLVSLLSKAGIKRS